MPTAQHEKSKTVLRRFLSFKTIIRNKPMMMFALGALTATAASSVWENALNQNIPQQKTMASPSGAPVEHWGDTAPKPKVVLSGVNGEAFSPRDVLPASIAPSFSFDKPGFQSAEILLPKKLQIGDILKLTANSGAVFSFKVARLAALCSADPSHQPVPDVALVECAERDRAEQWRYVIEAVNEPLREEQKTSAPRSL